MLMAQSYAIFPSKAKNPYLQTIYNPKIWWKNLNYLSL